MTKRKDPADLVGAGRPTDYTKATAEAICRRIASGQSMTRICELAGMPSYPTIMVWRRLHPEFAKAIDEARLDQADAIVEEITDVARSVPVKDEFGKVDGGQVAHNRLLVDTLRWRASKLKPKVYGDKQVLEHQGTLTIADLVAEAAKPPTPSP